MSLMIKKHDRNYRSKLHDGTKVGGGGGDDIGGGGPLLLWRPLKASRIHSLPLHLGLNISE